MTHRRRYPSHISTDTEWLGEIPAHWETHRFKALIRSASVWAKTEEINLLRHLILPKTLQLFAKFKTS